MKKVKVFMSAVVYNDRAAFVAGPVSIPCDKMAELLIEHPDASVQWLQSSAASNGAHTITTLTAIVTYSENAPSNLASLKGTTGEGCR